MAQSAIWTRRLSFPFAYGYISRGGIAFIFVRTDARQWHEWIFPVAHSILFIRGRIRFCDASGKPAQSAPTPSALVAYSAADTLALKQSGIKGYLVQLKGDNV
jgi:hypothetical protein